MTTMEKPSEESMVVAKAVVASATAAFVIAALEACSFSVGGDRGLVLETKSYLEEYNNGRATEYHTKRDRRELSKLIRKGD